MFSFLKTKFPSENNIFNKRETLAYYDKCNNKLLNKRLDQKYLDYLGTKEFNSFNLNDKKYLRTNSSM